MAWFLQVAREPLACVAAERQHGGAQATHVQYLCVDQVLAQAALVGMNRRRAEVQHWSPHRIVERHGELPPLVGFSAPM
eukprot:7839871-Pyramimonas_sp.AAC.1